MSRLEKPCCCFLEAREHPSLSFGCLAAALEGQFTLLPDSLSFPCNKSKHTLTLPPSLGLP